MVLQECVGGTIRKWLIQLRKLQKQHRNQQQPNWFFSSLMFFPLAQARKKIKGSVTSFDWISRGFHTQAWVSEYDSDIELTK